MTINEFNEKYPVGSEVFVKLDGSEVHKGKVRYEASMVGDDTPVIWVTGIRGAYMLSRVVEMVE